MAALEQSIADGGVKLTGLQGEIDRINREINALGAVNLAALPEPVRRGVITWVRAMLALARLARREFGSLAARVLR